MPQVNCDSNEKTRERTNEEAYDNNVCRSDRLGVDDARNGTEHADCTCQDYSGRHQQGQEELNAEEKQQEEELQKEHYRFFDHHSAKEVGLVTETKRGQGVFDPSVPRFIAITQVRPNRTESGPPLQLPLFPASTPEGSAPAFRRQQSLHARLHRQIE
jgi:hypothetical protein